MTFRSEPAAVYVTALGTLTAIIVALLHLDAREAGALATATTAAGTLITALLARPWHVAVIAGAAGTILQALVVFNVPLSAVEIVTPPLARLLRLAPDGPARPERTTTLGASPQTSSMTTWE